MLDTTYYLICILFDLHIFLSELHRIKFNRCFDRLKKIVDEKKYICTMDYGVIKYGYEYFGPRKYPWSLEKLYAKMFTDGNKIKFHKAEHDVLATIKIFEKIVNNKKELNVDMFNYKISNNVKQNE